MNENLKVEKNKNCKLVKWEIYLYLWIKGIKRRKWKWNRFKKKFWKEGKYE